MTIAGQFRRLCTSAAVLALGGCASFQLHDTTAQYRAFGDSITYGSRLPDRFRQAYPFLVADSENMTGVDYGIGGDQACDIAARQIFPNNENPALDAHAISSILIGTNDVDQFGVGAHEQVFKECHLAVIAWQALPKEYKVLAGGAGFQASGPGEMDLFGLGSVWTTGGKGASASFVINLKEKAPIYAWPLIDDSSDATYTYAVDGEVVGTADVRPSARIATGHGTTRSLGFIRFPEQEAGDHVITFTQTSPGNQGVSVVGIGSRGVGSSDGLPVVLVGTIPFQMHTGVNRGCQSSEAPCLEYIKDIESNMELLVSDGLDLRLFDTRKYMFATAAEMRDILHPNALGHRELAKSVEAAWPQHRTAP